MVNAPNLRALSRKLTDTKVKASKPKPDGRPENLTDGGGLYLHVKTGTNGRKPGKFWRYNYRIEGRMKTLSIGVYPTVTLQLARERHDEARALLARGIDPAIYKKELQNANSEADSNTFEAVAREWFIKHLSDKSETHRTRTTSYLERDVFPFIGKRPITEITPRELISVIERISKRITHNTHIRVLGTIGQIFRYAFATGRATLDPTASLKGFFKQEEETQHFPALTTPTEVGRLLSAIDHYPGQFYSICALKLSALVMLRPGELIEAEWAEIDVEAQTWTIEVRRLKAKMSIKRNNDPKRKHIIPLSHQALAIFEELKQHSGGKKYVFQGMPHNHDNPMSRATVNMALRRMGFKGQMTAHGFRGMASTLLNQMRDKDGRRMWDADAIERQLTHQDHNVIRSAYNRADYLDERRDMLQSWADYLDELRATTGQVLTFKTKAV